MQYQYRVAGLQRVPAQIAGEMCAELENSESGLTAKSLLDANRPKDAPLHDEFEWNDSAAAERYRLSQAQSIIRNIVIVRPEASEVQTVRAFVNVVPHKESRSYMGLARVLDDDALREQLLEQSRRDMIAFTDKYGNLQALSSVIETMRKALAS